jgi:hypothetical protein
MTAYERFEQVAALVVTSYEKTASSFLGVLCLAAAADWLKL